MRIIFKSIEYKNFRSVGNSPVKINLNKHKTTLIHGKNGAGKTTVMSALCFGLFGKGFGAGTKQELLNSINQKQLLVTVTFSIGSKEYKIVRGIKPNIFEIYVDDVLVNQDPSSRDYQKYLEQQILKLNYRSFTQVVLIGGGDDYIPFMKLPAKERREFVEELLDIKIFSTMNTIAKEQSKLFREKLKDVEGQIRTITEKVSLQKEFIQKLKKEKNESVDKVNQEILTLSKENEKLLGEIQDHREEITSLGYNELETTKIKETVLKLNFEINDLNKKISKGKERKEFYESIHVCPTCEQEVSDAHKRKIIDGVDSDITLDNSILERVKCNLLGQEELRKKNKVLQDLVFSLEENVDQLNRKVYANNTTITRANQQLQNMNSDSHSIDSEEDKMKEFAKHFVTLEKEKSKILKSQQEYDLILQLLTDSGIKSKIIKQYIPLINKLINKYLDDLDFHCLFCLDEGFNESIKSRHRDLFTYNSFSAGQKRRIDVAILMAWKDIAKAKSAVDCNVIFLDEIDSVFDADGSSMFHEMLKVCSTDHVFLMSHKPDIISDKVDHTIKFELVNNFTEMSIDF